MSYSLLFTNCKQQQGKVDIRGDVDPYNRFAFYADRLLTGLDLGVTIPGTDPEAHFDQVSLHWIDDFGTDKEVLVTTVYLVCACKARIEEKKRAQSPLLTQKQKLYLPKR